MTVRKKLEANELRETIFARDNWTCQACGGLARVHGTPQLAHRISKSKMNLRKYGEAIINHPLNLVTVCSSRCNDAVNIGFNPEKVKDLLRQIESSYIRT